MNDVSPAEQAVLLAKVRVAAATADLPEGWLIEVTEYGGDGEHTPGARIDITAVPLGQGRWHTVPWVVARTYDIATEIEIMVMELHNGNTVTS